MHMYVHILTMSSTVHTYMYVCMYTYTDVVYIVSAYKHVPEDFVMLRMRLLVELKDSSLKRAHYKMNCKLCM